MNVKAFTVTIVNNLKPPEDRKFAEPTYKYEQDISKPRRIIAAGLNAAMQLFSIFEHKKNHYGYSRER